MAMATAPDWQGPYQWNRTNIFAGQPDANHTHIEDAHIFVKDSSAANPGSYHAIFHSNVERMSKGASCGRLSMVAHGRFRLGMLAITQCSYGMVVM